MHTLTLVAALALGACGDNFSADPVAPEVELDMGGVSGDGDGAIAVGEDGSAVTFSLRLTRAPTAAVTMSVTSSDPTAGIASVDSITFTAASFSEPQAIVISATDDDIAGGDRPFSIHLGQLVSDDPGFDQIPGRTLSFVSRDDDVAGIAIADNSGMTTESHGIATFKVALTSEPTADVVLNLTSDDTSEGWVTGGLAAMASGGTASTVIDPTLTFTAANWNVPQLATVMGADDNLDDGAQSYNVDVSAGSDDPLYAALAPIAVTMLNADNDTAGIAVGPISGSTTEAGGTASFGVVLQSEPLSDVVVTATSSKPAEGTAGEPLVFTAANWYLTQMVTVTGANDFIDDGNADYEIGLSVASLDALYAAMAPAPVAATNIDDDTADITVSAMAGLATESGGTATFDLTLSSEPIADVVLTLSIDDATEGSLSATELTFTAADWNDPQTITVTGVNDDVADGTQNFAVSVSAASGDLKYAAVEPALVELSNADNDAVGVAFAAISGPTTELGGTATFDVVLESEPTADVVMTFTSSDLGEGTVSGPLTFTSANWAIAQTVTVTGVNDDIDDGNVEYPINVAISSEDLLYNAMELGSIAVINNDDDTAGVAMGPISGDTTEAGGTATFDVVLTSEPTATVDVHLFSSDQTEGLIDTSPLTFTVENWDTPQTASVTGNEDFVADGDVLYAVTADTFTGDLVYANIEIAPLAVLNLDNDTAGITVSAISRNTDESGAQATFTVVLGSEPVADVTVTLGVDDATEGSLDKTELTFTALNWFEAQTVTVTGLADQEDDGPVTYNVIFAVASQDGKYNEMLVAPVAVTNDSVALCTGTSLAANFDDGTTSPFALVDSLAYTMEATAGAAAGAGFGLALTGTGSFSGAHTTFASNQPTYVRVLMRRDDFKNGSYFVLGNSNMPTSAGAVRISANFDAWMANESIPLAPVSPSYEQFELFLDWNLKTYDVHINGSTRATGVPFLDSATTGVTDLHLFNTSETEANYDDIFIGCF